MAIGHAHAHEHPAADTARSPAALLLALAANGVLAVVQVAFGLVLGSVALLADAAHQVVDVLGIAIAVIAIRLARRGPTPRNTFGWARVDALGAQASAVLLLGSSVWLAVEAGRRLGDPASIDGAGVIALAVIGLVVNGASALALTRGTSGMSVRAAVVHLVGDAAGSAGVLVAGVAVVVADATWVDPAIALAIAAWVAVSGVRLLRSASRLLLGAAPSHLEPQAVQRTLEDVDGVLAVHHLHLWELGPGEPSLSAHLVIEGDQLVHDAQHLAGRARQALVATHHIRHATLEVECHGCDDQAH